VNLSTFLRGLVIGLSIAAPVGPIGVLCIRRTLADGRAIGFASGLGAATADGLYGAVEEAAIRSILGVHGDVRRIAEGLMEAAISRNASDNVSAVLLSYS
jgi:hypothetical protein